MLKIYLTLVLTVSLSCLVQSQRRRFPVTQREGAARSSDDYIQDEARFDPRSQYPTSPRPVETNEYQTSPKTRDINEYNRRNGKNQYRSKQRSSDKIYRSNQRTVDNQYVNNQRSDDNQYLTNQRNDEQYNTNPIEFGNNQYQANQRSDNQYYSNPTVDNQYQHDQRTDNQYYTNQRAVDNNYQINQENEDYSQYSSTRKPDHNQYHPSSRPEEVDYYSTSPKTVDVSNQHPTNLRTVEVSNHYPTNPKAVDADIQRNKFRRKPKQTYYPKVVSFYQKPTTNNGYEFKYETADGVQRAERGYLSEKGVWTVEGSVISLDDENTAVVQSYIADGSGYKSSVRKHTAGSFRSLDDLISWNKDNYVEPRMSYGTVNSLVGG